MSSQVIAELGADGLEVLGTVRLGAQTRLGDLSALVGGGGQALATRPGTWWLLARPLEEDPDLLEEVVAIHEDELGRFYELYDGAARAGILPSSSGRFVVAGASELAGRLAEMGEVDREALPWVLEDALVVSGVHAHRATLLLPRGEASLALFSLLLAPPLEKPASPSLFQEGGE